METPAWSLREVDPEVRRRFTAEGWWPDHSVGQRMADGLAANSRVPFVIHSPTRPWAGTFGDVLGLARRAASGLFIRGVRPGDVVTFQTPNWLEGAVTFYAAALAGAVVAPIVHIYGSRETSYILRTCRPKVHVTASQFGHQDFLANLEAMGDLPETQMVVLDGVGPTGSIEFSDLLSAPPIESPVRADPDTPALVGWTSGTTASPKGVIHSHQTVCAEIAQLGAAQPPTDTAKPDREPDQSCDRDAGRAVDPGGPWQARPSRRPVGSRGGTGPDRCGGFERGRGRAVLPDQPARSSALQRKSTWSGCTSKEWGVLRYPGRSWTEPRSSVC